jgi:hypothetical protein
LGDVLVFGCYHDFAPRTPWLVLRETVWRARGALIPAHPFRRRDRSALWYHLERHHLLTGPQLAQRDFVQGLAAIEILNASSANGENKEAAQLARVLDLPGTGGSDAHVTHRVGKAATWFPGAIRTDRDLVAALRQGGYHAVDMRTSKRRVR